MTRSLIPTPKQSSGCFRGELNRHKGTDYRKRGRIERFFSILKMKPNLLNVRVKGLQKITAYVNSCIFGYLLKYII